MNAVDLVIRNGTRADSPERPLDIVVANGEIVSLEKKFSGKAREEIDATGLHIFPGIIDAHVHFNEPGRAEWEGFETGSRALAAGGGTCFLTCRSTHIRRRLMPKVSRSNLPLREKVRWPISHFGADSFQEISTNSTNWRSAV